MTDAAAGASRGIPPGGAMLHPVALAAVALLLLNDHVLKPAHPGFVTGKLSDIAGLVFFPLFVVSAWEVVIDRLGRWQKPSARAAIAGVVATGLVFTLVKTTTLGAEAYRFGLGALQWPFFALADLIAGLPARGLHRVAFTRDPGDLLALPALGVPLWLGLRRARARAG